MDQQGDRDHAIPPVGPQGSQNDKIIEEHDQGQRAIVNLRAQEPSVKNEERGNQVHHVPSGDRPPYIWIFLVVIAFFYVSAFVYWYNQRDSFDNNKTSSRAMDSMYFAMVIG